MQLEIFSLHGNIFSIIFDQNNNYSRRALRSPSLLTVPAKYRTVKLSAPYLVGAVLPNAQ